MSESSPFRTDGDKEYRWPPEPAPIERTYKRVTSVLGAGEPQPWMKPWVLKLVGEFIADMLPDIAAYSMRAHAPGTFDLDAAWFADTLRRAGNSDEKLIAKGRKPYFVDKLLNLTPRELLIKYVKAIPDIKRDTAANVGTAAHHYAELLGAGQRVDVPSYLTPWVDNTLKFFEDFNPRFIEQESVIYNDTYGYAGQFDWLAEINGKIILGDYKTSAKGIKDSVALQLAAYRTKTNFIGRIDGTKTPMPHVDECWAVNITDQKYEVIPVRVDADVWQHFLSVLDVGKWMGATRNTVLGKPLAPVGK